MGIHIKKRVWKWNKSLEAKVIAKAKVDQVPFKFTLTNNASCQQAVQPALITMSKAGADDVMLPNVYRFLTDIALSIGQPKLLKRWKKFYIKSIFKHGFGAAAKVKAHGKLHMGLKIKGKTHIKGGVHGKLHIGVHGKVKKTKAKVHVKVHGKVHGKPKAKVGVKVHGKVAAKPKAKVG